MGAQGTTGAQGAQGKTGATGPSGAVQGFAQSYNSSIGLASGGAYVGGIITGPGKFVFTADVGIVASADAPHAYPGCKLVLYQTTDSKIISSTPIIHGFVQGTTAGAVDIATTGAFSVGSASAVYDFCVPEAKGQTEDHFEGTAVQVTNLFKDRTDAKPGAEALKPAN